MALLVYLLKANVVFIIGFAAYLLLLKREPRFTANRWVLLAIALGSVLLPALPEPRSPIAYVQLAPASFEFTQGQVTPATDRSASMVIVYFVGLTVSLSWFLFRLGRTLWRMTDRKVTEAFSFFGFIAVPQNSPAREAMLAHEQAHARAWHSADVLLMELLAAISWFDPLWRWALHELRLVHEHEADAAASEHVSDYDAVLVAEALGVPSATLLNRFRTRTLKTRLLMLHRKNEPGRAWRYGIMIPVAFVALISTGWKADIRVFDQKEKVVVNPQVMPQYPGGQEAMVRFLNDNLQFPAPLQFTGAPAPEGITVELVDEPTVYIQFVVDSDGRVKDVRPARERDPYTDEAVRAIEKMPLWTPGQHNGRAVPVQLVLPVKFKKP